MLRDQARTDNYIHTIGLSAGVVAVTTVMAAAATSLSGASILCLAIYGAGMLAMLGCSAAYHMELIDGRQRILQRLDHAAIFLMIAGTYTPFAVIKIGGRGGLLLLVCVWTIALLGAAGKLLLASTWDRVAIPLYLLLGWLGLVALPALIEVVTPSVLALLAVGGSLYTVGVIFHLWHSLPYQKAVWHAFVLAGTVCQFAAVTITVFA